MKKVNILAAMVLALSLSFGVAAYAGHGVINVNSATESELLWLPGINASDARDIVEFRDNNGPFASKNDLLRVRGIDMKKLDVMNDYIILQGRSTLNPVDLRRVDGHGPAKSNN